MKKLFLMIMITASISFRFTENIPFRNKSINTSYTQTFILFNKNSHVLTSYSKRNLDSLYKTITSKAFDTIGNVFLKYRIILYPDGCKSEYLLDKFIGVKRATEIIDYLEDKYGVRRRDLEIIDIKYSSEICLPKNIGVEVGLVRRW